jgi:MinD-like ATPase involved in chromosome partitioning or flagellar assembly
MSRIVSIHSFRGGTGKSNTTANLAGLAALNGMRVGVVDTDIQSPGIHVLFGLNESKMGHTLNEFLRGDVPIEDVAFNIGEHAEDLPGLSKLAGKSLYLIPSSIKSQEITAILRKGYDVNVLNEGLQTIQKSLDLDYLFIDTHPGLQEETLLSILISDVLIIILRPDSQDFQGTAVTVDVAKSLDVPDMMLIVNKALTKYDFNQIKTEVEGFYGTGVAGVLPLSEDLVDLGSSDLFTLKYPDHPWSQALKAVFDQLTARD